MKRNIITTLVLSAMTLMAVAQTPIRLTDAKKGDTRLTVNNYRVESTKDNTILSMDFVLDSLRVASNRYRAFTPILRSTDGEHVQRLRTLLVTGRTQDIIFERDGIDPLYADNCDLVRRQNGTAQTYEYSQVVKREPWHRSAEVLVECDLCGCGDTLKSERMLLGQLLPPDPMDLIRLTDIVPDPYKAPRNLHGSAFITFVVDRWELKPDYMNNRRELRKITDTLDVMTQDRNISVNRIQIHGWASPESPYEHNRMLATNRAQSLTDYVRRTYGLPAEVFAPAKATPENWIGLREAVVEMDTETLPHKQQILDLIDDDSLEPDPKEWRIKQLYPQEYRYLLQNVYPHLRRSDYDISFSFRDFTLEEACEIYKTKPHQLSLRELWDVANTHEVGSDEYNRVLQTAVNLYPDSTVAQLNLANVALRQRDLLKAETLLERAGDSGEAENARAVLCILREQYAEAEDHLAKAERLGVDVAANREAIEKLR